MKENKRETCSDCKLKAFIISHGEEEIYSRSYKAAKQALEAGMPVRLSVHVKGEGDWVTGPIDSIKGRAVSTAHHVFNIRGRERPRFVSRAEVLVEGGGKTLLLSNPNDKIQAFNLFNMGANLVADVTDRKGHTHMTSRIVFFDFARQRFTTERYSIYCW